MNVKRLGICSALLTAVGLSVAIAAPSQGMMVVTHATPLSSGDVATGPLALTQPLHVVIGLRLRNKSELDAFLVSPRHAVLTPAQFAARYAPTSAEAQAVGAFLSRSGFRNVKIASNRLLISADGTAAEAAAAFKTSFIQVHTHDGREAYANSTDVQIPATLQNSVQAVLGLQNLHIMRTLSRIVPAATALASSCDPDRGISCQVGHDPTQFAAIYNATSLPAAFAVPAGIVTWGSMTQVVQDLNTFTSHNGLATIPTQVVVTGTVGTSGPDEWDLDSQSIVGMSGGVQKIIFYVAPGGTGSGNTDANLTVAYNAAVAADAVKVINVSIGGCETSPRQDGSAAADDQIFEEAVAQGQTFSVSSGDIGADECRNGGKTPSWPASSQYVVAVGGTSLFTSVDSSTQWVKETVWNDGTSSATGGSPSTFEPMPTWQKGVGQNAGHSTRGVPDIAFDASPNSGAVVIVDGQNEQIGGTSLASPLFVGAWARMIGEKGEYIGFAAPLLYQVAGANYASDFHDVAVGNNNGEIAATGWDYTTGFGSLVVDVVDNNINASMNNCGTPVDINGDGKSDLLLYNPSLARLGWWLMNGTQVSAYESQNATLGWHVAACGDFNGDGKTDIAWVDSKNNVYLWFSNGGGFTSQFIAQNAAGWTVVGAGDVNGDGKKDLLVYNPSQAKFGWWLMNGTTVLSYHFQTVNPTWLLTTIGDFNGDGKVDVVWTDPSNNVYLWTSTGDSFASNFVATNATGWSIVGSGDVNGDREEDLLVYNPSPARLGWWLMNGSSVLSYHSQPVSPSWKFATEGDFNGDGKADIAWLDSGQALYIWTSNGSGFTASSPVGNYTSGWWVIP